MKKLHILLILLTLLILSGGLNYSGMCITEGRWLSDEERIRLEIERIINKKRIVVIGKSPKGNGWMNYDAVPYDSVEQFLKQNPNCCSLNYGAPSEGYNSSFWRRITGYYHPPPLNMKYIQQYLYEGNVYETILHRGIMTTNCGKEAKPW